MCRPDNVAAPAEGTAAVPTGTPVAATEPAVGSKKAKKADSANVVLQMQEAVSNAWNAAGSLKLEPFKALIAQGARVNISTREEGWTLLMVACGLPETPATVIRYVACAVCACRSDRVVGFG